MTPIIAIASGKGGVGKTSLTLNIAATAAKLGKTVLVFDGDFGLANIDIQLGLTPKRDIASVLAGQCTLVEAILPVTLAPNIHFDLIPGRSGTEDTAFLTQLEQHQVLGQLHALRQRYDIILLDVPAGLDNTVLNLCQAASQVWVVATPDPSSITDSYALIKLLRTRQRLEHISLLINQAANHMESQRTAQKLQIAAHTFLKYKLPILAHIPFESSYRNAVKTQTLAVITSPHGKVAHVLGQLVQQALKADLQADTPAAPKAAPQ